MRRRSKQDVLLEVRPNKEPLQFRARQFAQYADLQVIRAANAERKRKAKEREEESDD